jgi:ribosomal-protein-alanine N-acetyltransferase
VSADLSIEPMAGRHVGAVRAIDELTYPTPWSVATWRNELASADRHHVVAVAGDYRDGRAVVGHAGLLFVVDEVHVTTVAVHPDAQGRGIATRMLVVLLREARVRAATAATLEVRATDRRTQRLYGRFGFQPVGVRRSYYSKPVDDAVVMWLDELGSGAAAARLDRIAAELRDDDRAAPVSERTT